MTSTMQTVYISTTRAERLSRTYLSQPWRAFGSLLKALYTLTVAALNLQYRWNYLAAECFRPTDAAYMLLRSSCPPCSLAEPIASDGFPAPCIRIIFAICWSKREFCTRRSKNRPHGARDGRRRRVVGPDRRLPRGLVEFGLDNSVAVHLVEDTLIRR